MPRPHWRKMTWTIIIWSVLMAIWIIAALVTANPEQHCAHEAHAYLSQGDCESARNAGTGIGVVALWLIWFFGFIVLSLIWLMTRPKGRICPACGERVKKGVTVCKNCGHDFAASARQGSETTADGADQSPRIPPGWHADPHGSSNERYWDGQAWTDRVREPQT
jgi:lysylphosphatidylglycerol synthetase-like protein (DUF2156 family)